MARVAGADIPDAKRVEIALTYIHWPYTLSKDFD
ncbi:MAG: hypothetical protein RL723_1183 [Actinomycetota bacterium]